MFAWICLHLSTVDMNDYSLIPGERFLLGFSVAVAVNMAVVVEGMWEGNLLFLLRDQLSLQYDVIVLRRCLGWDCFWHIWGGCMFLSG